MKKEMYRLEKSIFEEQRVGDNRILTAENSAGQCKVMMDLGYLGDLTDLLCDLLGAEEVRNNMLYHDDVWETFVHTILEGFAKFNYNPRVLKTREEIITNLDGIHAKVLEAYREEMGRLTERARLAESDYWELFKWVSEHGGGGRIPQRQSGQISSAKEVVAELKELLEKKEESRCF